METITLWLAKLFDSLKAKSPLAWALVVAAATAIVWLSANHTINLPPWALALITFITTAGGSRTTNIINDSKK